MKYEDITIEQLERLQQMLSNSNIECDIVLDADNRDIQIDIKQFKSVITNVCNVIYDVVKAIVPVFRDVFNALIKMIDSIQRGDKKITKKRFIKLLRSKGMQRKEINNIIKGNKEPYTMKRYYNTISPPGM